MKGVLLVNLGTPDTPEPTSVARYLKQFLMDKWVVDIPYIWRWILVNVLIIPRRKYASSEAYHQVWTERGSPLRFHLQDLAREVKKLLPAAEPLEIAMRYGSPSIREALQKLKNQGVDDLTVLQLYPQYAESSTRTSQEEIETQLIALGYTPVTHYVAPFYDDPGFIHAYAARIAKVWEQEQPDHLLLSFHGLPERHVKRTDPSGAHCLAFTGCCDAITEVNSLCYRAQCYATARALAAQLGLAPDRYTVSFQSRLGRTPWIQPYTDFKYPELARAGVRKLAVACPSFVADCLETLEEIGIRGQAEFIAAGGQTLTAVPCVNSDETWALAVRDLILKAQAGNARGTT